MPGWPSPLFFQRGTAYKAKGQLLVVPEREKSSSAFRFQTYRTRNVGSAKVSDGSVGKGRFSSSIAGCIYYSGSDLQAMSPSGNNKSGHQRRKDLQNSKCKHSSEKALLKHACMLKWNSKEQAWAQSLELHFHPSINPYWRDLWKTFYAIHTYNLNHPQLPAIQGFYRNINSQLAPSTGFLLWHQHLPHTPL